VNGASTLTGPVTTGASVLVGTDLNVLNNTVIGSSAMNTVNLVARVNSNVVPAATNTYDLGSLSNQWRDLYVSNNANLTNLFVSGPSVLTGPVTASNTITAANTVTAPVFCATSNVQTDLILEKTLNSGVTIDGVLIKDSDITCDELTGNKLHVDFIDENTLNNGVIIEGVTIKDGDICVDVTNFIKTDTILETTMDAGVNIDGVVMKDGDVCVLAGKKVLTDTIIEKTPNAGVTIEGVLLKDGNINLPGLVSNDVICASIKVQTDVIEEKTLDAGVTIDSVLLKDNIVTATQLCAISSVLTNLIGEKRQGLV
jgi:hypothetical protein